MTTLRNLQPLCNNAGSFRRRPTPSVFATDNEKRVVTGLSVFTYLIMIVIFCLSLNVFGQ